MVEDEEKKAKSGLMRRWFGGGEAPVNDDPGLEREADVMGARAAEAPQSVAPVASAPKQSWLQRLRLGLSRSSTAIARGVTDIFTKRKLDAASLDDLEDVLIQADLGLAAASRIREAVGAWALRARDQPRGSQSRSSLTRLRARSSRSRARW